MTFSGILNINKPVGMTSYDVIRRLKKHYPRGTKIGHAGTLDPMAEGVLPIAIGKATKSIPLLPKDKRYLADILLGMSTTTDDREGDVLQECDCSAISQSIVEEALQKNFVGKIQQKVPLFSAVHRDGQRLYDLARKGEVIDFDDLPEKTVEIFSIEMLSFASETTEHGTHLRIILNIHCGSGTYIRSLARDLGRLLGVCGSLAGLRRTLSGGLVIEDSMRIEEVLSSDKVET